MILTKGFFKRFQYGLLVACVVAATLIGSVQTGFIIRAVKQAAKKAVKENL